MYCTKKLRRILSGSARTTAVSPCLRAYIPFRRAFPITPIFSPDEKTVLFDTVDKAVSRTFFENLGTRLGGRPLDYVIVHHMEPDHSATLSELLLRHLGNHGRLQRQDRRNDRAVFSAKTP